VVTCTSNVLVLENGDTIEQSDDIILQQHSYTSATNCLYAIHPHSTSSNI